MSHNPRFTLKSSIKNISISHRECQVIHDSFLRNKSQIIRPLYPTKTITYKHNALKQRFEYTDQRMPVAMTSNGQKYYLHYDQVGSLRAISDTNHNIVKEITYDTYGNILTDSNEAFSSFPSVLGGNVYESNNNKTNY